MTATIRFTRSPIAFGHPQRPLWAIIYDRMTDLSDVWIDECDPQNIQGAMVMGFMSRRAIPALDERHNACVIDGLDLDGIAVTTPAGTEYHDRAALVALWGQHTIDRIEAVEMEAAE